MNINLILEMASAAGDRAVVTAGDRSLTATELGDLARGAAERFRGYRSVLYLGANHLAYPVALVGTLFGLAIVLLRGLGGFDVGIHFVMLAILAVGFGLLFTRS